MDNKLKIFWNLDMLVKMSRSKSDGLSLRIEENELVEKVKTFQQEIEEIKLQNEEDTYDSSAEMADRNIEIITKKQLQLLKTNLKEKNDQLSDCKEEEQKLHDSLTLLQDTKDSQEKYIISMQERISEATNYEIIDRYNSLIAETTEELTKNSAELKHLGNKYKEVQQEIVDLTDAILNLEDKIDKKKKLLLETQDNLQSKANYIDITKQQKNNKRIKDLEEKIQNINKRLEELRHDPKYLESKVKEVINSEEDPNKAKPYLLDLINIVIKIPYINVEADNALEEELLKATQARDSFVNEMDQKSYNILELETPENLRISFLSDRITKWENELEKIKYQVSVVDKDEEFSYETKNNKLYNMISTMKKDLKGFIKAYDEMPDTCISQKASLKAQVEEKQNDIKEAEKIATAFRTDESNDIEEATRTMKVEYTKIKENIAKATKEINAIRDRLTKKKTGLIDINAKNKDKEILRDLAQIVIDIKHRRQFAETPIEIITNLEHLLNISLKNELDSSLLEEKSNVSKKDYDQYIKPEDETPHEIKITTDIVDDEDTNSKQSKRGYKVINEAVLTNPLEEIEIDEETNPETKEESPIENDNSNENLSETEEPKENETQPDFLEPTEDSFIDATEPEMLKNEEVEPVNEEIKQPIIEEEPENKEMSNIIGIRDDLKNFSIPPTHNTLNYEDENVPLDIDSLINGKENNNENKEELSINSIFNDKNSKNDDNISNEELSNELDNYINNIETNQER